MEILFLHQNFPAQFKHLAPSLVKLGHKVVAIRVGKNKINTLNNIDIYEYLPEKIGYKTHPWLNYLETKVIRAECVLRICEDLKKEGFNPDIIIAHPGWGETLFVKEVWPKSKLVIYCEYYYISQNGDLGFDPEFPEENYLNSRIKLKNLFNHMNFDIADLGISPTKWQASTYPELFRKKISVIHDGIDTSILKPYDGSIIRLKKNMGYKASDEIITYVSRNLEPYRGFHTFMRAIPELMRLRPNAKILVIGGNDKGYGQAPPKNKSWRDIYYDEIKDNIDRERLIFLGKVSYQSYIQHLQISSIHIYLTYPFVLSWSMLEAMSIGCIVLGSSTKPVQEVIQDELNGYLIDFFDSSGLAKKVNEILKLSPLEQNVIRLNARRTIESQYELNNSLEKQIALIKSLNDSKSSDDLNS